MDFLALALGERAKVMSPTKDSELMLEDPKKVKRKTFFQQMTICNSEAIVGINQLLRAVEAVSFEFYIFDTSLVVAQAAKACAGIISEKRKEAQVQKKTWQLGLPYSCGDLDCSGGLLIVGRGQKAAHHVHAN